MSACSMVVEAMLCVAACCIACALQRVASHVCCVACVLQCVHRVCACCIVAEAMYVAV